MADHDTGKTVSDLYNEFDDIDPFVMSDPDLDHLHAVVYVTNMKVYLRLELAKTPYRP